MVETFPDKDVHDMSDEELGILFRKNHEERAPIIEELHRRGFTMMGKMIHEDSAVRFRPSRITTITKTKLIEI